MNSKKFNSKKAGFDDATSRYELNPVDLDGFSIINTNILDDLADKDDERAKSKNGPVHTIYVDPKTMDASGPGSKSSQYFAEDLNNKRRIFGALASIPRMLRETKHKCKTCHGVRQEYDPKRPMEERIVCPDCLNNGHELSSPESGMMDRANYAWKKNRMADFHERACGTLQCNPHCAHKDFFDKIRASFPGGPNKIRTRDIKLRPNTTNHDIVDRLTPEIVEDNYKPIAKILQAMGGREDEPLQKHDVVYTNFTDTVNPGSHLKADYDDEGFHAFQETYEQPERGATPFEIRKPCPTCGCKECNANGIKLNEDGDYVDCEFCKDGKTHTGCKECNGTGKAPDIQTDQGTLGWPVVVPENVKLWEAEGRKGPKPEQAPAQMRMHSPKPLDACAVCGKSSSDTNHTRRQFPVTQSESQQAQGPKDNGAFGIIVNANPEGTRGDRISFYTPVNVAREDRNEILGNGGHPERGISLDTGDFFDRDPDIYDSEDRGVRKHIESTMADILPLIGERSDSKKMRITYEQNVPLTNSARISPVTAPLMATAGKRSLIRRLKDVKGSLLPRNSTENDKKIRTTTLFRKGTGLDEATLRAPELSTGRGDNLEKINDYIKNSLEPDYAKLQSNNPELPPLEQVKLSSPTYGLEAPSRDESRKRPSTPKGKSQINEDIRSSFDMPKAEVPDMGNFDLSNPENQKDAIETFEGNIGRKLEPEERAKVTEGITKHNHIDGAYKALGMKTPEEEEDHEQ